MSSGTTDKIKGRVKEAAGDLTGNQRLKNEGRTDQAAGKVKNTVERVVDKVKEKAKKR
ncbi:MAG: CsbD family protein [Candidatus Binataceae bacterium]